MKDMSKIQILSGSWLKVIAMVTMLFDHMAVFLPYFHEYPTLYFAMRTIGRTAFIIFAFLLAEGFIHTHNRRKYGRNLTIFALISQLPYSLIHNDFLFYTHTNVGFTLLLAFLGMLAMEYYREDKFRLVAVLAAMAEGTTNITGVAHARVKETDRIDTTCRELEKLGCKLVEHEDGMSITGGVSSGVVDSHGDHRLAMAFSLIGLKHDIEITNGEVFDVSFPNFIESMAELGFELELENE